MGPDQPKNPVKISLGSKWTWKRGGPWSGVHVHSRYEQIKENIEKEKGAVGFRRGVKGL